MAKRITATRKLTKSEVLVGILMLAISLIWFIPVLMAFLNSFKPFREIMISPLSFPDSLYLGSYVEVWNRSKFLRLLGNSTFVLVISLSGVILFGSMAGYRLARMERKKARALTIYFYLAVLIPFQAIMITLVKTMNQVGLINSLFGLALVNIALGLPMTIFLYTAGAASTPRSLDESAAMDGCSPLRTFFSIILPCMSNITGTVIILSSLVIWNDFMRPLVLLTQRLKMTIPVGTALIIQGQFMNRNDLAVASLVMASAPLIVVFIIMQKRIVVGIIDGAVKG